MREREALRPNHRMDGNRLVLCPMRREASRRTPDARDSILIAFRGTIVFVFRIYVFAIAFTAEAEAAMESTLELIKHCNLLV